jgi:hypothetical protein
VEVVDGAFHEEDSKELVFKKAGPILLEPILKV